MIHRSLAIFAVASATLLAGCGDDVGDLVGTTSNEATVKFVNATGSSSVSVANNGTVGAGNSALGFGGESTCMAVNTANPNLTFTNSATGAAITGFTPTFTAGGNYTVIGYTGANGTTQFATLNNAFTPSTGQTGLRVFNAASGSGNVVVLSNGTVLNSGATTSFGNAGSFFSTNAGAQTLTFNTGTGTATIGNTGSINLTAGRNTTVVLAPAATGSTALRSFIANGC
jgi:hypothetical protein